METLRVSTPHLPPSGADTFGAISEGFVTTQSVAAFGFTGLGFLALMLGVAAFRPTERVWSLIIGGISFVWIAFWLFMWIREL